MGDSCEIAEFFYEIMHLDDNGAFLGGNAALQRFADRFRLYEGRRLLRAFSQEQHEGVFKTFSDGLGREAEFFKNADVGGIFFGREIHVLSHRRGVGNGVFGE